MLRQFSKDSNVAPFVFAVSVVSIGCPFTNGNIRVGFLVTQQCCMKNINILFDFSFLFAVHEKPFRQEKSFRGRNSTFKRIIFSLRKVRCPTAGFYRLTSEVDAFCSQLERFSNSGPLFFSRPILVFTI